jgi:hypothetical protein
LSRGYGTKDWGKLAEEVFLETNHPWIANFKRFGEPIHVVIVDKIVKIRDPWGPSPGFGVPSGLEATMKMEEFAKVWTLHAVYILKI